MLCGLLAVLVEARGRNEGFGKGKGEREKGKIAVEGNGRLLEGNLEDLWKLFPHNVRATSDLPAKTYLH